MEFAKKRLIDLNPAPYNPRVRLEPGMPAYEKLRESITKFGNVEPIVWNKKTGNIVGGHQRHQVLMDMAIENGTIETAETEVIVINVSVKEEKTLNLALNKITGMWDEGLLGELLSDIKDPALLELTGFEAFEIENLTTEINVEELFESREPKEEKTEIVESRQTYVCPHCGKEFEV